MTYIITHGFRLDTGHIEAVTEPRIVSTPLEAREECVSIVSYNDSLLPWRKSIDNLPEAGGIIGPLPNGTVIKVVKENDNETTGSIN